MKAVLVLALAFAALVAAAAVAAKEGVRATLTSPVPQHAAADKRITLSWTLTYREDGQRRFFGAGGVFVRLLSASGSRPSTATATGDGGRYRATVRVPSGGIGGIRIGLHGRNDYGAADVFFPITNNPFRK